MSNVIRHVQCPACAAAGRDLDRDNLAIYDDGHSYCFSCKHSEGAVAYEDMEPEDVVDDNVAYTPLVGDAFDLPNRGLHKGTLQKFGVFLSKTSQRHMKIPVVGTDVLVFPRYRDGQQVGQKLKTADKNFAAMGSKKRIDLFGQHLWKPKNGKRVVITEGEEDCMALCQVLQLGWPVVSLPDGTGSCEVAIRRAATWLEQFDEVIIMFDPDEAGKIAAEKAAAILKPGKAYIVTLPNDHDITDMLVAGRGKELYQSTYQGKEQRPDGLVKVGDVDMDISFRDTYLYPYDDMNSRLYGRRSGELVLNCSGSGMGKTSVLFEMLYKDLLDGRKVGGLFLEMPVSDVVNRLVGMHIRKPVQKIMASRNINANLERQGYDPIQFDVVDDLLPDEYNHGLEWVRDQGLILYNHFGSQDSPTLLRAMEHLAVADQCPIIYLDHISIVISGQDSGNERLAIDNLMTKLASLTERTGAHIQAVSHLKRKSGTSHEEGGQISLSDLRGSGSLGQLAHSVIGFERNQQHADERIRNTMVIRSLKDRFGGFTGVCAALYWNNTTNRLEPVEWHQNGDELDFTYADGVYAVTKGGASGGKTAAGHGFTNQTADTSTVQGDGPPPAPAG